ncbi:hypothetical protein B0H16DRAFT_1313801 [Mycena metata]|uniref:Uncharacterized protein n=1 Tax=Mycena metata TaxID=1033252 RepID=A0AAD7N4X6_9AGAR|nr:hypothetical protein B0H16DRAFT_1321414 [Mycena metata]KAJ7758609.1 hypothetical protein B0H16DRAFT_1313801 [Mycena metata]
MRQVESTPEDDKLRAALANMRYAACTSEDLSFLRTRIAGLRPSDPRLDSHLFRNVAIITAWNSQKDVINRLGAKRFAEDTDQDLSVFYSIDRISSRSVDKSKWKRCEQSRCSRIGSKMRNKLWNAAPSSNSEHLPGKLLLCLGMPFLLRTNDATELCMTKGQESVVVGWDESIGPDGQRVLDTLFVHLENLPADRTVQIAGLPPNVVPLIRTTTHITVLMEDDTLLSVAREQVTGLLNFAITDYTAQGKSRPENPVDLTNCKDHKGYYVALSRATTAAGTIILQEFDESKVTCGATGYLRQELRELEVLDEITRLRYQGLLPREVTGVYRRQLLRAYARWTGSRPDPDHFHPAMRLRGEENTALADRSFDDYGEWAPSGTKSKKRDHEGIADNDGRPDRESRKRNKKTKHDVVGPHRFANSTQDTAEIPTGLVWDSINYSCGYDALFTILYNVWSQNPTRWTEHLRSTSRLMSHLSTQLAEVSREVLTFEDARDSMRSMLHTFNPNHFPYGTEGTSIDKIVCALFPTNRTHARGHRICNKCGYTEQEERHLFTQYLCAMPTVAQLAAHPEGVPISTWVQHHLGNASGRCPMCAINGVRSRLAMQYAISVLPSLVVVAVDHASLLYSRSLCFDVSGTMSILRLRGVIYGGGFHFTARYITDSGAVWFHDGMSTGRECILEGNLDNLSPAFLRNARGKPAINLVYAEAQ